MTRTDATCYALIALAVGLVVGVCVGWHQAAWYYEGWGTEEPRVERLHEVEEIEPERIE